MVVANQNEPNWTGPKLFSYLRYDPNVSQAGLNALGLADIDARTVQVLDSVEHIQAIQRVGASYAREQIQLSHFAGFLS
jgi:hypothetical protein